MSEASQATTQTVKAEKEAAVDSISGIKKVSAPMRSVTEFFACSSYRSGQREVMLEIEDAFKTYNYLVLEAPTGAGKSQIAFPFALKYNDSYILTVMKVLQDQYARDFGDGVFVMKGKGEYICLKANQIKPLPAEVTTCAKGWCERQPKRKGKKVEKCEGCPYRMARMEAAMAPVTAYNYDAFYYQGLGGMPKRQFMLIDEAHNLEGKTSNFVSFTISNRRKKELKIPDFHKTKQYEEWLKAYYEKMSSRLDEIDPYISFDSALFAESVNIVDMLRRIDVYFMYKEKYGVEYVSQFTDHKLWQTVTFRPLFVNAFTGRIFWNRSEKFLMMSATILDKKLFCESVGLDPAEVKFIQKDSTFPVENRPLYLNFVGSMSYKNINDTLPKIVDALEKLLQYYRDDKGIVQTHSEKIASYIKANCHDPRLTFNKDYRKVEDTLRAHRMKPGSFIVASGLREGLDLHGDLSRVQVLCKVPYANLGDKWVKERMARNPDWYGYNAVLSFVQSIGRSVRSETDVAKTYVLDSNFTKLYNMYRRMFPKYVTEAFIWKKKK